MSPRRRINRRSRLERVAVLAALVPATVGLSACGVGKPKQVAGDAKQTIEFAVQGGTAGGLGSEGTATAREIAAFERAHPNVEVDVLPLSSTVANSYQQVAQRFVSDSSTPDVIDCDNSWPAGFARAGWVVPLERFGLRASRFLPGASAATTYRGRLVSAMWYLNVEGLYYRTDLVKRRPRDPEQLVAAAQQALRSDPKLREGLAFEGSKYEGMVTAFIDFLGAFGGKLDPEHMNTPANLRALQFFHDVVYRYRISPQAVTGWTEQNAQEAFTSGQAAFAIDWPYVLPLANAKDSAVAGKTGFIPFPSASGAASATLAGDSLVVNARSAHLAAAGALVRWMMRPDQQAQRAIASGDPPSVSAAYTPALFAKAPTLRAVRRVFRSGVPRLVSANYQQVTTTLQDMLSSVLANEQSPADALAAAAKRLADLQNA